MRTNMLVLNDGKTEIVKFSSKFDRFNGSSICNIRIGDDIIIPSVKVRNLGVIMDNKATMSAHVSNLCRSASFALYKIGKIRNILDQSTTEKLVHAFVTSRLDYCNSLLFGLPAYEIRKVQLIQNSAARLITRTKKHENITPVLKALHWLPIQQRIEFKLLCFVFKILHGMTPAYLNDLLLWRCSGRALRSSAPTLFQPLGNCKFYGDRAFFISAPRLWNVLPSYIRVLPTFDQFKSHLKTHLFIKYFDSS